MTQGGSADDQGTDSILETLQSLSDRIDQDLSRLIESHSTLLDEMHGIKYRLECVTTANGQLERKIDRLAIEIEGLVKPSGIQLLIPDSSHQHPGNAAYQISSKSPTLPVSSPASSPLGLSNEIRSKRKRTLPDFRIYEDELEGDFRDFTLPSLRRAVSLTTPAKRAMQRAGLEDRLPKRAVSASGDARRRSTLHRYISDADASPSRGREMNGKRIHGADGDFVNPLTEMVDEASDADEEEDGGEVDTA